MEACEIKNAVESIKLPEEARKRILAASLAHGAEDRAAEKAAPKRIKLRRVMIAAVAAVMLLTVTAYAVSAEMGSWNAKETGRKFSELPTAEYCLSELGYVPLMTESFENGYVFTGGGIEEKSFTDRSGGIIEEYLSLSLDYEKEGDRLSLSTDKFRTALDMSGDDSRVIDGVKLMYGSYVNKVVPADYELTAEDMAARDRGELVFSYGSEYPYTVHVQSVFWELDGIKYFMTQLDGALTEEELFAMAGELIARRA